jgi:hypothetical protein
MSWRKGVTKKDSKAYPYVILDCDCKTTTHIVSGAEGFEGRVPKTKCCGSPIPYPSTDEFREHLFLKPKFDGALDKRFKASPMRDPWSGDSETVSYSQSDYSKV